MKAFATILSTALLVAATAVRASVAQAVEPSRPDVRSCRIAGSPSAAALGDAGLPADPRRFTGIVAKLGGAPAPDYDHVSIAVDRYSVVGAENDPGAAVVIEPLAGVSAASGFITIDGMTTRRLVLAQTFARGTGQRVVLVFAPSLPDATVGEIFGVVVLDLDRRGRGTGELIAGATLVLSEDGELQIDRKLGPVQLLADVKVLD